MKIRLPNNFAPRAYQKPVMDYMERYPYGGRLAWCVHRRGGKDLTLLHATVKEMIKRKGQYWHVYPVYAQARKAIWQGIRKDGVSFLDAFPEQLIARKNAQTMSVELVNGSIWQLIGSDNVDTIVGAGPVGIVFSEYALCDPRAWQFLRPILKENGGWAAFISTPRGRNHFHEIMEHARKTSGWFCQTDTALTTGVLPPSVVEDEIADGMTPEFARQEYLCDFESAPEGSIWADLLTTTEPLDFTILKETKVFTSWDLGHSDATAIWFWAPDDKGLSILDYYENHHKPLSHYFDEVARRPFSYAAHYLPHDARAHTLQSSLSIMEQTVERFGSEAVAITPSLSLQDGIQAARWLLQRPIRFHANAKEGLKVLKAYHNEYNHKKKVYSTNPLHDWSSHGSDAFRYLAIKARGTTDMVKSRAAEQTIAVPRAMYSFSLEELWDCGPQTLGKRL